MFLIEKSSHSLKIVFQSTKLYISRTKIAHYLEMSVVTQYNMHFHIIALETLTTRAIDYG